MLLPQVARVVRTRETKDLSLPSFVIMLSGAALWGIYGLIINDPIISLTNALVGASALTILIFKLRFG
jgi:MtN3 and saliva related transmembrane protein